MKTLATAKIFFALVHVAFCHNIPDRLEPRIVGGSSAPDEKYPYTVSLRVYFEHFCGGSILNDRWILTSAHCIARKRPDEISVIAGTNLLTEAGQMYQAIFKILHPEYNGHKFANDIGLILVSRRIVYTNKIQPISLPTENFNKTNYPAVFSGWGGTSMTGNYANRLQEIKLTVISQETCSTLHENVTANQICTLTRINEGACHGDEGGPLVADGKQIGISSFFIPCARGYPDVFTRVWIFVNWIDETIRKNNNFYLSID